MDSQLANLPTWIFKSANSGFPVLKLRRPIETSHLSSEWYYNTGLPETDTCSTVVFTLHWIWPTRIHLQYLYYFIYFDGIEKNTRLTIFLFFYFKFPKFLSRVKKEFSRRIFIVLFDRKNQQDDWYNINKCFYFLSHVDRELIWTIIKFTPLV